MHEYAFHVSILFCFEMRSEDLWRVLYCNKIGVLPDTMSRDSVLRMPQGRTQFIGADVSVLSALENITQQYIKLRFYDFPDPSDPLCVSFCIFLFCFFFTLLFY